MPASYIYYVGEDLSDEHRRQNEMISELVTFLRSEVHWHGNSHETSVQVKQKYFQPIRHILGKLSTRPKL